MISTHPLKNCPIVDPFARELPKCSLEWRLSAVGVPRHAVTAGRRPLNRQSLCEARTTSTHLLEYRLNLAWNGD